MQQDMWIESEILGSTEARQKWKRFLFHWFLVFYCFHCCTLKLSKYTLGKIGAICLWIFPQQDSDIFGNIYLLQKVFCFLFFCFFIQDAHHCLLKSRALALSAEVLLFICSCSVPKHWQQNCFGKLGSLPLRSLYYSFHCPAFFSECI